MQCVIA